MTKKTWIEKNWAGLIPVEQIAIGQTIRYMRDLNLELSLENKKLYGKAFYLNLLGGISKQAETVLFEVMEIDWEIS